MLDSLRTIQSFVAPVVVISANGLLSLALYNRLAVIVGRVRTINKERFDLSTRLSGLALQPKHSPEADHLRQRVHVLDELGHQLFLRARLIRDSLMWLLATVLCMLACSLALGLEPLAAWLGTAALALFVLGILVMMVGIVRALQELWITLDPLVFEHQMIEATHHPGMPNEENGAGGGAP